MSVSSRGVHTTDHPGPHVHTHALIILSILSLDRTSEGQPSHGAGPTARGPRRGVHGAGPTAHSAWAVRTLSTYHRAAQPSPRALRLPTPDMPTPDMPTPDMPTPDMPTPDMPTPGMPTGHAHRTADISENSLVTSSRDAPRMQWVCNGCPSSCGAYLGTVYFSWAKSSTWAGCTSR